MNEQTTTDTSKPLDHPPVDDPLLQEITRRIVEGVHPERIILFGSRARGTANPNSDIDIFVEMNSKEMPYYRHGKVRSLLRGIAAPMDLIVMTPEEVAERKGSNVSLVPIIEREGHILYHR